MAEHFGLSATIVRLAFLLGVFFSGGIALLVYVALWIAMPLGEDVRLLEPGERPDPDPTA